MAVIIKLWKHEQQKIDGNMTGRVYWIKEDDVTGATTSGSFLKVPPDDETQLENVTDIETRINADEGKGEG